MTQKTEIQLLKEVNREFAKIRQSHRKIIDLLIGFYTDWDNDEY